MFDNLAIWMKLMIRIGHHKVTVLIYHYRLVFVNHEPG